MRIITAAAAGMCFGVRDALEALATIERPRETAIYGELVHNDVVLHQLEMRGFRQMAETQRTELADASRIVITAHGISQRRRQQLVAAGKTLIDTTCPLVARLQRAAQDLARSGAFVVVIGHREHVEVEGIIGDLASFAVVPSIAAVGTYTAARLGVVCQTTFPGEQAAAIRRQIAICNPAAEILWVDTICQPTKDRQQALSELIDQVQAVVVVGGRHSHNTLRLADTCRKRGLAAFHVQHAKELIPSWFDRIDTVGLTAGTSTLPETIREVHDRLTAISVELNRSAEKALKE
jgi:4-hydroxy-3-methylbut-2-enyl diphosphate reductase